MQTAEPGTAATESESDRRDERQPITAQKTVIVIDSEDDVLADDGIECASQGLCEQLKRSKYGEISAQVAQLDVLAEVQLQLPKIVVIGSESSGKSSTLERIAMQPFFPRSGSMCTRCGARRSTPSTLRRLEV